MRRKLYVRGNQTFSSDLHKDEVCNYGIFFRQLTNEVNCLKIEKEEYVEGCLVYHMANDKKTNEVIVQCQTCEKNQELYSDDGVKKCRKINTEHFKHCDQVRSGNCDNCKFGWNLAVTDKRCNNE